MQAMPGIDLVLQRFMGRNIGRYKEYAVHEKLLAHIFGKPQMANMYWIEGPPKNPKSFTHRDPP
jgi:hypothetical protein